MRDDLISRQAAIDAIKKDVMGGLNYEWIIKELPSIQPKQKTGRWIEECGDLVCSKCKFVVSDPYYLGKAVACPNCGAYMKGGND